MLLRLLISAVLLACTIRQACAQGLVLVRERGSASDTEASLIAYTAAERSDGVFRLQTPAGVQSVEASRIVRDIEFSRVICPSTMLTSEDMERLTSRSALLSDTIERWPESKKLLQRYLDYNQGARSSFERGYVLKNGRWMTRSDYVETLDPALRAEEARQRAWAAAEQKRENEALARVRETAEREEQFRREEAARQVSEAAGMKEQQMRKRLAEAGALAERNRRQAVERQEQERRNTEGWLLAAGLLAGAVFGAYSLHASVRYGVQVVLKRSVLQGNRVVATTTPYTRSLSEVNDGIAEIQGHLNYCRAHAGTQYCRSCAANMPITFRTFEKSGPAYIISNGYGLAIINQTTSSEFGHGCSGCGERFYFTNRDAAKEYEATLVKQKAVRAQILKTEEAWKILQQWSFRHPLAAGVARVILGLRSLRFRGQPIARKGRKKERSAA